MKTIIHIGIEKTGTTSIQKYLWKNRTELLSHGIYIPEVFGPSHYDLAVYCNSFTTKDLIQSKQIDLNTHGTNVEKNLKTVFNNARKHNIHTVVFSSEHLSSRLRSHQQIMKLKSLFPLESDIKIIVYLRKQSSYLQSLYNQAIKAGGTSDFKNWYLNFDYQELDYNEFLDEWIKVFSKRCIEVREYGSPLVNNDVVADFCHTIGYSEATKSVGRNKSLNKTQLYLIQNLNKLVPYYKNGKKNQFNHLFQIMIRVLCFGQRWKLSDEMKTSIDLKYQQSNDKLYRKFRIKF